MTMHPTLGFSGMHHKLRQVGGANLLVTHTRRGQQAQDTHMPSAPSDACAAMGNNLGAWH